MNDTDFLIPAEPGSTVDPCSIPRGAPGGLRRGHIGGHTDRIAGNPPSAFT